ncbi:AAA family ATPase [Agrococcus casei]|uniref:AAA family ATPase n=1 Tax=Agrococcus casei TaxID=343512 RepID=UPI003F9014C5
MLVVALALSLDLEDRFAQAAVAHAHDVAIRAGTDAELIARFASTRADIAIVGGSPRLLSAALIAAADAAGIRVIALADSAAERDRAKTLSVQSLPSDTDPVEVFEAATAPIPAATASDRGTVIAVWGPHGAPGRTTAAIGIAAELAFAGAQVALIDADTHAASVAPSLGLLDEAPGFAAAARLAKQRSLTDAELDRVAATYECPGGELRVLTGIGRSDRWPELQADRVAKVLDQCRSWKQFTVVDTSASLESDDLVSSDLHAPRRNAATLAALQASDIVYAVTGADPVSMTRFLRVHGDLTDLVGADRVRVIVNKVRTGAAGLAPGASAAETLQRFAAVTPAGVWPADAAAAGAALLAGQTLREAAPRSALRKRITDLVQPLLPEEQRVTRRSRRGAKHRSKRRFGRASLH